MNQATNSRNRSSARASRPTSVVGALADALLVEALAAVALTLACLLIALNDVSDPFVGDFLVVRFAMLPPDGVRP
jgi:hypothetical protein